MDDLLRGSASRPLSAQTIAPDTIRDLFENVQLDAPRQCRRTLVIALPVAVLAAGALTAGGIAISTFDWTGEVDVPISYTTDSGRALTCTAVIQTGAAIDADVRAMIAWLRRHRVNIFSAFIHPDHEASMGVAKRLGFTPTSTIDDGEIRWERNIQ